MVITNYIDNNDPTAPILEDKFPDQLVRVYPYLIYNADKERVFAASNSISIVSINQNDPSFFDSGLKQDEDGEWYFEMIPATSSQAVLDTQVSSSTLGQELAEEAYFTCISNWYPRHFSKDIKIGATEFLPFVCSVGNKYQQDSNEKKQLFLIGSIIEGRDSNMNPGVSDKEGQYEFSLININTLTSNFQNTELFFTKTFDTTTGAGEIRLNFDSQTLLSFVNARGGDINPGFYNEIDLTAQSKLMPIKFTPISVKDKITMYADWFDYDLVMPYFYVEKFKAPTSLSTIITNADDLNLVYDMLGVSAGFASNWVNAPVLTSGGDAGKIKPDYRVGSTGIKVFTIAGLDPIRVIDGIFEAHTRKHPTFLGDKTRNQPVKMVLAALSRYIYSSYSIGKGQNSFNQIYLPWYLEPSPGTSLEPVVAVQIPNPDSGAAPGDKQTTYVINSNATFICLSHYFRSAFSSPTDLIPTNELKIPNNINLSSIPLVQTDRKLEVPIVYDTLQEINKLPLPGDIQTNSSQDLNYIFYVPVKDEATFKNIYLSSANGNSIIPTGTRIDVFIPDTNPGTLLTQSQANVLVLAKQPGILITQPTITIKESGIQELTAYYFYDLATNDSYVKKTQEECLIALEAIIGVNKNSFVLKNYDSLPTRVNNGDFKQLLYTIRYQTFGAALVELTSPIPGGFSLSAREILFDKKQWTRFLNSYHLNAGAPVELRLRVSDGVLTTFSKITFGYLWGDKVGLYIGTTYIGTFPLFNQDDETITVQNFIFT